MKFALPLVHKLVEEKSTKHEGASTLCRMAECNTRRLCRTAYAAKLITSALNRIFCQPYFSLQKLRNEKHAHIIRRAKNYISLWWTANVSAANRWWDWNRANRIFMLHDTLKHAMACRNCVKAMPHWRLHGKQHFVAFCHAALYRRTFTNHQISTSVCWVS